MVVWCGGPVKILFWITNVRLCQRINMTTLRIIQKHESLIFCSISVLFDWENSNAPPGCPYRSVCLRLLEILSQYLLSQLNTESTRESAILDLFITNKPGLVKACTVIPGLSDHEVFLADCDIRAASARKQPRSVFKWGKADWSKIKEDLAAFRDRFIPAYESRSVEEN